MSPNPSVSHVMYCFELATWSDNMTVCVMLVSILLLVSSIGAYMLNSRTLMERVTRKKHYAVVEDGLEAQEGNDKASANLRADDAQIARRKNFAIISHPDAGKTTLTEKLLLFGGAIQDAGAVKAKRDQRSSTSDWMEIEKARGISVTSTVLTFEYKKDADTSSRPPYFLNILDTPGHADFSEDTYRTLAAADNCVMLVDAAKGIEDRTRKLFEVCRMRKLPVFTMVNKMDR